MVTECDFIILSKTSRDFAGIIGVQRMPSWTLGLEFLKMCNLHGLGKISSSLISKENISTLFQLEIMLLSTSGDGCSLYYNFTVCSQL